MRTPCEYLSPQFLEFWNIFSRSLKNQRTRENYFSSVCLLCEYTKCDFLSLTSYQVQAYFDELTAKSRKEHKPTYKTICSKLAMFHSISEYACTQKDQLNIPVDYKNIFLPIRIPEISEVLSVGDVPTVKEVDKVLIACEKDTMLFCIVTLAFRCGLTASEICSLKPNQFFEDANKNHGIEFHRGKTIRRIKVPEDVMAIITPYVEKCPAGMDYLFYNKRGLPLKVRNLESYFSKALMKAGIPPLTIQDIRNSSVVYMLRYGADPEKTAEYFGVESRWMYRYAKVVEELSVSPIDLIHIKIY